jgi:hypothetical protein
MPMDNLDSLRHDHLPPELQVATQEFVVWAQAQLLAEQVESTPVEPLYHYTDAKALRSILDKQQVWCFRHLHQRDQTEFSYSLAIARRVIKEVGKTDDFFSQHFCGCLDDLLKTNSLIDAFEFYLFSLSRHRDDIQQWIEYGDRGHGFAMAFAPTLFQPDEAKLHEKANENLHVGRVIYGDGPTEERHRRAIEVAAQITSRVAKANPGVMSKTIAVPYLNAMAKELIASQLVWNCLTAKSISYENESEVRYVIMNVPGKFDALRKPLNGKHYIEADLPLKAVGNIKEILIGPLAPVGAESIIRDLLKELGYSGGILIRRSTVSPWRLRFCQLCQYLKRIGQSLKQTIIDRWKNTAFWHRMARSRFLR